MKSRLSQTVLGVVVLGALVVCGWMMLVGQQAQEADRVAAPQVATSPQVSAAPSVASEPKVLAPQVQQVMDSMQVGGERPPLMPRELIASVLEENKPLKLFMYYHKHVLLDENGRNEYRKLLSDPEMMRTMAAELKEPGRGEVEPKEQYRRLMQVDYFKAALDWKDNPQREQLLRLTADVVLHQNIFGGQDTERRYMLAGGKMEMYRLLYEHDTKQSLDITARAQGTGMEKLVTWMAQENLRRRAQEQQIRAEMQAQAIKAASP